MKVKVDYCEVCHRQQIMGYSKINESYRHCLTCDTHYQEIYCGVCRCNQALFYNSKTEFIELVCPRCNEQMWAEIIFNNLEFPTIVLHLGIRNVTDNK